MKKPVLIIGGSAFASRFFSIQASKSGKFDLHVVNRGNFPLELDGVSEYKCNRHSPRMIARLIPDIIYDALVDFCAYEPGEIKSVIDALGGRIKQYIFFSTASVYAPQNGARSAENDPVLEIPASGENRDYTHKKLELESELRDACKNAGIKYTIFRPTYIYGPFNKYQRESVFIEMIARKQPVPLPIDSASRFDFIYVNDVADAIILCIGDRRAFDETFNLAAPEVITYPQIISDFERYNAGPFDIREVTVRQAEDENIPMPFPLTGNHLYDGRKFSETFGFEYTPYAEGMEKTFKVFYTLFTS